ncbi:MAG: hypothetical protein CVV02_01725 [Firmicutes bacterium HGW-Firmicutes-7]|nr:MAG: hypothetical protein CVV02_01725 [Firmicutes bacterium HGW-Firmicutes-7]
MEDIKVKYNIHTNYYQDNLAKYECLMCNGEAILSMYQVETTLLKLTHKEPKCPYCGYDMERTWCMPLDTKDDEACLDELGCMGIYHHECTDCRHQDDKDCPDEDTNPELCGAYEQI